MDRKLREKSHLKAQGWTKWIFAMAPEGTRRKKNLEQRIGQVGFKNANLRAKLGKEIQRVKHRCGIYEWRATKHRGAAPIVVYLGSTCPRDRGQWQRMQSRIVQYSTDGNHKTDNINNALKNGYELWVRFKPAIDEEEAKRMENDLLARYDYAWNIRENGDQRQIL